MKSVMIAFFSMCFFNALYAQSSNSLDFDENLYTIKTYTIDKNEYKVRAYENIIYVANPVDTLYQRLNIYIPLEYYDGVEINGYTIESAPVFFPNAVGGYMPAEPMMLNNSGNRNIFGQPGPQNIPGLNSRMLPPMPGNDKQGSAIHVALSRGYIVVSAGARGRSLKDAQGVNTGKAPAGLVDLKAAIRYLKYNEKVIPGNQDRIVSNGTSAGGAMSALLGATGNSQDYNPYLEELGAALATDNIWAVSAYCPIVDLDHADAAYEWQFNGINTFQNRMMDMIDGVRDTNKQTDTLSNLQIQASNDLKYLFPVYLNGLNLKDKNGTTLTLDAQGEGNFKDYVKSFVISSAQRAMDKGGNLDNKPWFTVEGNRVVALNFEEYIKNMKRMKTPPAFDAFDLSAPENHLFGSVSEDARHFTDFSYYNAPKRTTIAESQIIKMMNPLYYIGDKGSDNSHFWHIRYGTIDNNTSLAIEVILATVLENQGYDVDFELAWDRPHMGDYDLKELFDWMDSVCKK